MPQVLRIWDNKYMSYGIVIIANIFLLMLLQVRQYFYIYERLYFIVTTGHIILEVIESLFEAKSRKIYL